MSYCKIFIFFTFSLSLLAGENTSVNKKPFLLPPILSALLPGLDQWVENQHPEASFYTGAAGVGLGITLLASDPNMGHPKISSKDNRARWYLLGAHIYQTSGLLSAYDSFRFAVKTRKEDFPFLTKEESTLDLLQAPFKLSYFLEPTTFVPLLTLGSLIAYQVSHDHSIHGTSLRGDDLFFSGAFSYGAGTSEEAFFRGYLMPSLMYYTKNDLISNVLQASLFAVAHGIRPIPLVQFIFGWYSGYLVQKKEWTLSESVFIHTWWDIIAFASEYYFREEGEEAVLRLPPIVISF